MANKDRSFHKAPERVGGEGWLYSEQQKELCHFKPDTAMVHAKWVAIRTYSYVSPACAVTSRSSHRFMTVSLIFKSYFYVESDWVMLAF